MLGRLVDVDPRLRAGSDHVRGQLGRTDGDRLDQLGRHVELEAGGILSGHDAALVDRPATQTGRRSLGSPAPPWPEDPDAGPGGTARSGRPPGRKSSAGAPCPSASACPPPGRGAGPPRTRLRARRRGPARRERHRRGSDRPWSSDAPRMGRALARAQNPARSAGSIATIWVGLASLGRRLGVTTVGPFYAREGNARRVHPPVHAAMAERVVVWSARHFPLHMGHFWVTTVGCGLPVVAVGSAEGSPGHAWRGLRPFEASAGGVRAEGRVQVYAPEGVYTPLWSPLRGFMALPRSASQTQ